MPPSSPVKAKVRRDQGDAHTVVPKLLEHREPLGFGARGVNLVIGSEAPRQRGGNAFASLSVGVDEEQHRALSGHATCALSVRTIAR